MHFDFNGGSMKVFLMIVGIIVIVASVLSLLYAALNLSVYHNLKDGSAEHYARARQRMRIFFPVGAVLAVLAVVCFIIRAHV